MNALANAILGLVAAALLLTVGLPLATGAEASTPTTATSAASPGSAPVRFGMDASSVSAQKAAGVAPDYGTFWIGPWTLSSGWGGPDNQLAAMKSAGVTPAIHFYYWGDDISPSCVENGCWSNLHKAQKTRAGWEQLGTQLTQHLDSKMGGAPVVVFLESEFNKGGISTYEPFDGYMAEMARKIHAGYPNAQVVLGFGAWDSGNWHRFDQAAAASDIVGVQAMRGSTRDSATHYDDVYESTLSNVKKLDGLFRKPVMLTDLALSSYPEPAYATEQATNLQEIMANLPTLKAAGLRAMVYRSWTDSNMDTANYYGEAERHWGLAYPGGAQKEAAKAWVAGVKAERSGIATSTSTTTTTAASTTTTAAATATITATTTPAPSSGLSATVKPSGNEWWVQAGVSSSKAIAKVEAKAGTGSYVSLDKQSYGWAKSFHVAKGTMVQFRVTAADGSTATTPGQAWLVDMAAKTASSGSTATATATTTAAAATTTTPVKATTTTTTAAATTTTAAKATTTTTSAAATTTTSSTVFTAKFSPTSVGNDYLAQTTVSASQPVAKVEVKVGSGGSWVTMEKTSTGAYSKSVYAPNGTYVQFRATSSTGSLVASPTYVWG